MANSLKDYTFLPNGVIKQININKKRVYDKNYVNTSYNTYGDKVKTISGLRLGYLIGSINKIPNSILDVGYGNGDFLNLAKSYIPNCYGSDISGYPVPEGITFVDSIFNSFYDVICFFDVLEHFDDIYDVRKLNCEYVFISVPWCHYFSDEWFLNWKHLRPDEHLWHFNDTSLATFFNECGYSLVNKSNIEDSVRCNNQPYQNILTCVFKKIH